MIQGKRILITGGGGFVGSHLGERLAAHNQLVIYDNGHRDAVQYTDLLDAPNVTFIKGDVLDTAQLCRAMQDCQMVVHLAAIAGIDSVIKKPIITMQVNLLGTKNALDAAIQASGVTRFVDFSTSEVYGPYVYRADENGLTTQGPVGEMRWSYAVSKLAAEHLTHCYYEEYKLPVVTIRPFNVYGPRQVGEGAVHRFIMAALRRETLTIYGDGNQIRAWCYVDDFVNGVLLALEKEEAVGQVFNLGDPKQTVSILGLAEHIVRLTGSQAKIQFQEATMPDVQVRVPSIHKARQVLGYEPATGLEEGLSQTIRWYQERSKWAHV
ncbi:MAG: NAD-dependent epimerase/dehydratase family protein [Anaerolineae bacterium]|nr:NAD-dependent epimerase/dehydratase family protein [Anaerolineae bacterium]